MQSRWSPLDAEHVAAVGGYMGVYELAAPDGEIVFIGYAGGRSVHGLKGELARHLEKPEGPELRFRIEITTTYLSRHKELLMAHVADHGTVPVDNSESRSQLGRLSPN